MVREATLLAKANKKDETETKKFRAFLFDLDGGGVAELISYLKSGLSGELDHSRSIDHRANRFQKKHP